MSGHTPGPWAYCARLSGSENHRGYYIKSRKFVLALDVVPVDADGKEGEANARLIAAAPELLAALEAIKWRVHASSYGMGEDVARIASEAIAKATGGAE